MVFELRAQSTRMPKLEENEALRNQRSSERASEKVVSDNYQADRIIIGDVM
jgi:hypothetical protein|tara:strand:+ start:287 stop:439 length:153 start_codon:yes stop_codon:yes gene_type:complete